MGKRGRKGAAADSRAEAGKFHGATRGTATEFNNAARGPRDRLEFNTNLKEISSVSGAPRHEDHQPLGRPFRTR